MLLSRSPYTRVLLPTSRDMVKKRPLHKAGDFVRMWGAILWLEYEYIKSICMKHNHWDVSKSLLPTSIFFPLSYFITCTDKENQVWCTKGSTEVEKEYGN